MRRGRLARVDARVVSERLEPRALLAAVAWDGGGDDGDWHNPLNWDGDVVPGAGDDVTIGAGTTGEVIIGAGQSASVGSIELEGALRIDGVLEVARLTRIGGEGSLRTGDMAEVRVHGLAVEPGSGEIRIAGQMAIDGRADLARDVGVTGEVGIAGQAYWTGGEIVLEDEGARLIVMDGGGLRGRFVADQGAAISGVGTLVVGGTLEAFWSAAGTENQTLQISVDLDMWGTARVRNGTLGSSGEIVQKVALSTVPEEDGYVLTGGVWEARRNARITALDGCYENAATLHIGPGSSISMGLYVEAHRPPSFARSRLLNTGSITVVGGGAEPFSTEGYLLFENRGLFRKTGDAMRALHGIVTNEADGRFEIVEGWLRVAADRDPFSYSFSNRGELVLGDLSPEGRAPRLILGGTGKGRFEQSLPGSLTILAAYDGQRFRVGAIEGDRGEALVAGSLEVRVTGVPTASAETYRWTIVRVGTVAQHASPATTFQIEGRTGELRVKPLRLVVVAAP